MIKEAPDVKVGFCMHMHICDLRNANVYTPYIREHQNYNFPKIMTCLISSTVFPHFLSFSQGFPEGISFSKSPEGWEIAQLLKASLTTKMSINHLNRSSWRRLCFASLEFSLTVWKVFTKHNRVFLGLLLLTC